MHACSPLAAGYCKSKYHSYWMRYHLRSLWSEKWLGWLTPSWDYVAAIWSLGGRMLPLGALLHTGPHDWAVSSNPNLPLQYELHSNSLFTRTPLLESLPSLLNPSVPITLWELQTNQSSLNNELYMWHVSVILPLWRLSHGNCEFKANLS